MSKANIRKKNAPDLIYQGPGSHGAQQARAKKKADVWVDSTNLARVSEIIHLEARAYIPSLVRLHRNQDEGNIHQRLQRYKEYSEKLLEAYFLMHDMIEALGRQQDQAFGKGATASRKRWTEEEDSTLIDKAVETDSDLTQLAILFNRTPGAISSRLTHLVGIKRLSQSVAGRLTGYINGNPVEDAVIMGELRNLPRAGGRRDVAE